MKKTVITLFIVIVVIMLAAVVFSYFSNNRIIIEQQDIRINQLPEDFEGFTILQITDLHEKEFGDDQEQLIAAINSLQYDAIVFTGDLLDDTSSLNYESFYKLIREIKNKEHALYVAGNNDPENYILSAEGVLEKSEFVKGMEEQGVMLLESLNTIQKGDAELHFVNFDLSIMDPEHGFQDINGREQLLIESDAQYIEHQNERLQDFTILMEREDDVLVALSHYPIADAQIDYFEDASQFTLRDYDLIIAGHYHGGQMRLPSLGALFVPEAWNERNGLLPSQDRVKGLWEYQQIQQYVSAGLGSSESFPFLNFRVFNPPEINLLRLTNEKK
ncbi:metallophosphoesterase [Jeotgalibacillus marinus]|uniref:Metallophosphoesterase n=1 Tax=Jeotgalibacillus marinus TaxID=86667 RepID=A0ABV3Q118_9BACL